MQCSTITTQADVFHPSTRKRSRSILINTCHDFVHEKSKYIRAKTIEVLRQKGTEVHVLFEELKNMQISNLLIIIT